MAGADPAPAPAPVQRVECAACRFYFADATNRAQAERLGVTIGGECRRFPAALRKQPQNWCGEFEAAGR